MLSTHVVGEKGEWCDYPLFPEVFRKAGYNVTFITNEFLPQAKEAVYDFSGGFFLNNPELSKLQFDHRNTQLHDLDDGLLKDYDDSLKNFQKEHNLTIFHLMGQHVNYKQRYRTKQARFWASSYEDKRPELTNAQRKMLSHYDNATLYNDSIVAQIVKRFQKQDAIVIYVPDHGEECYEENRGFICRNHSAEIDWPLAHYEFEIPFWIYCSPKYIRNHRDIYRQIRKAKDKRFMTDALPHLLLYLAGIETPTYKEEYNILSPKYDEMRPRILKNSADYDKLRDAHLEKIKKEESKKVKKKERRN
jgi:heptose-I-phosphate ethanolaminephosphotransferase